MGRLQFRARLLHAACQRPDSGGRNVCRPGSAFGYGPAHLLCHRFSVGQNHLLGTHKRNLTMTQSLRCPLAAALWLLLLSSGSSVYGAEKLTVLLDWFINPDHAPLFVAYERGYFQSRGLEVEFIAPSNPNDPPKLVAAGKADLAVSYQHQHQMQVDQGLPLVRVATLVATPLNSLVVLADGDIRQISDLKGKTIGYSVGGFETVLLKVMLEKASLSLDDVKLINVNFSLSPSLFTGSADGVIGAFRNFELNQMAIENRPGRAFFVEEYGIPAYDELILVANRDSLD